MELHYRVHSATSETSETMVEFEGAPVRAALPHFRVELTVEEPNRQHGTLVLRFPGAAAEDAAQLFRADETGVLTLTPDHPE